MNGVSVILCTYNGSSVIRLALQALAEQKLSGPGEIVLVDNNSTDGVAQIAEQFWAALPHHSLELRIVEESRPGLAFARRTGVLAARYDRIIFCDDDNLFAPDYLAQAIEALADPAIGAAGGECVPVSDGDFPPFFYTHAALYAVGSPDLDPGVVDRRRGWLFGAGLVVRRRDLLTVYESPHFPTLTGRVGSQPTASGEDLELCFSLRLLGYKLLYSDRLRFRHHIESRKLSKDYVRQLQLGNESDWQTLTLYQPLLELDARHGLREVLVRFWRILLALLRGRGDRLSAFWLLSFFRATTVMNPVQRRLFEHYRKIRELRISRQPT